MPTNLQKKLIIDEKRLREVNDFLTDENNTLVTGLLKIVEKYGGPEEINRKAQEAGKIKNLR